MAKWLSAYKKLEAELESKDKRIAGLEKENAELKEKLKEHESIGNAQFWENVWSWKTKAENLTKAKEIIKGLLELGSIGDGDYTYVAEAGQFIKDSEVEK